MTWRKAPKMDGELLEDTAWALQEAAERYNARYPEIGVRAHIKLDLVPLLRKKGLAIVRLSPTPDAQEGGE